LDATGNVAIRLNVSLLCAAAAALHKVAIATVLQVSFRRMDVSG